MLTGLIQGVNAVTGSDNTTPYGSTIVIDTGGVVHTDDPYELAGLLLLDGEPQPVGPGGLLIVPPAETSTDTNPDGTPPDAPAEADPATEQEPTA